jgi:hypothetical protein
MACLLLGIALVVFAPSFITAEDPRAELVQAALPGGTDRAAPRSEAEQPVGVEGEGPRNPGAADFFPVLSLYVAAQSGEVSWRPDWPLSLPPDAFTFPPHGGSVIALVRDGEDSTENPAEELTVRRNDGGLLSEFPLFKDGVFSQVQTHFGRSGLIRGFTIAVETPPPETAWDILIVEYEDAFPSLIRISRGEAVYFTLIEYEAAGATEIWYNQEGNALAVFSYRYEAPGGRIRHFIRTDLVSGEEFTETYHYDSMGNISALVTSAGEYSALYAGKGRPRYWECFIPFAIETALPVDLPDAGRPEPSGAAGFYHYSFQWDEEGALVRLSGIYRAGAEDKAGPVPGSGAGTGDVMETDIRYEYVRDEQGAWIERRDTPMIRRSGFLVPGAVERLFRRIEYPAP